MKKPRKDEHIRGIFNIEYCHYSKMSRDNQAIGEKQ